MKMETDYYPNGWLRIRDIIGMVIAPISITLPIFFWAIVTYQSASSIGSSYSDAYVLFFVALGGLILLGYYFGGAIKSYVTHQATRDDVKTFRMVYSGLILGSLVVYFMILASFLYGPKL